MALRGPFKRREEMSEELDFGEGDDYREPKKSTVDVIRGFLDDTIANLNELKSTQKDCDWESPVTESDLDFFNRVVPFEEKTVVRNIKAPDLLGEWDRIAKDQLKVQETGEFTIITDGTSEASYLFSGLDGDTAKPICAIQQVVWETGVGHKTRLRYQQLRVEDGHVVYGADGDIVFDHVLVEDATLLLIDKRIERDRYANMLERVQVNAFPGM